jgi:predicted  nucleic acid-binding Zn-ribbon protein
MSYLIDYTCPDCGHQWQETYECACDSECPQCGARNISAVSWAEVSAAAPSKQTYIVRQWRVVEREAKFQATSPDDAIAQAREVDENESDWDGWETSDSDAGRFIATATGETPKQPFTVILQLDEWDDWSIYHVDATDPRAALLHVLLEDLGMALECEDDPEEVALGYVQNVSVLPGTHSEVFGPADLKSNH